MYTIGNMATYIASYIISNVDSEFNKGRVVWLSAAALASQGVFMPMGGLLAPKLGVRLVVIIGSVINSGIYMLTYFAIQKGFIYVLLTHVGSLGLGIGLSYSVVMQTASSWFPEHSGLIVGLIAAGFGLGAFVFTPIQLKYVNPNNIAVNNETRSEHVPIPPPGQNVQCHSYQILNKSGVYAQCQLIATGHVMLLAGRKPKSRTTALNQFYSKN
ncbi:unnamed protein product [Schistocephalus solidus]|uniref:MFS domain-containing protein n=1 Tax=Schistocephalus solidus TaxID=70667 RepID=A0A183SMN6_SCHSO|nr:unnamed protein product [Schistocephalus solidus]